MANSSRTCKVNIVFNDDASCMWKAHVPAESRITYSALLRGFVGIFNVRNSESLDANDLMIFSFSQDIRSVCKIECTDTLTCPQGGTLDILIRTKDQEPITNSVHCKIDVLDKLIEIGNNYAEKKKYRAAFVFFNEAGTYGLWNLFKLLYKIETWKTIADKHVNIIDFIPNTVESKIIIAEAYEHLGKIDEAIDIYKNILLNDSPSCKIHTGLSRLFVKKQNLSSATVQITNALILDNQNQEAILQLAKIYLLHSNYEASVKTLLRCSNNYKYIPQFFQNDLSFTKHFLGTITALSANTQSLLSLCRTLYKNGSVNEPLTILKNAYLTSKCNVEISLLFFSILLDQNQFSLILEHSYEFAKTYCHTNVRGTTFHKFYDTLLTYHGKVFDNQISDIKSDSFNSDSYIACVFCIIIAYYFEISQRDIIVFTEPHLAYSYCASLFANETTLPIAEIFFLCHSAIVENMFDFVIRSNTIMCIGDQNVIQTAFGNIKIRDNISTMKPFPFYDLSIWKLRKTSKSPQKERFFSILQKLSNHNGLIIMLGTFDCEVEIPKLINKYLWNTVTKAIKSIIEIYISLLKTIKERHPTIDIFVHPALARFKSSFHIVTFFNSELQKAIEPYEGIYYIDIPNIQTKQISNLSDNLSSVSYSQYCNLLDPCIQNSLQKQPQSKS